MKKDKKWLIEEMNNMCKGYTPTGWEDAVLACLNLAKQLDEPKFYAKIKGWELVNTREYYFVQNYPSNQFYITDDLDPEFSMFTKSEWNELGINETNADFEEVEE